MLLCVPRVADNTTVENNPSAGNRRTNTRIRARLTEHNRCCFSRRSRQFPSGKSTQSPTTLQYSRVHLALAAQPCCSRFADTMRRARRLQSRADPKGCSVRQRQQLSLLRAIGCSLCHLAARGWPMLQSTFADTKLTSQLRASGTYVALPVSSLEPPLSPLLAALTTEVIGPPRSQLLFFGAADPSSKLTLQSTYHAATGRLGTTLLSNGRPHVAVCADVTNSQDAHFSDSSSPALCHGTAGSCHSAAHDAVDAAIGDTPMADAFSSGLGANLAPSRRADRRTVTTCRLQHKHVSPSQYAQAASAQQHT